MYKVIAHPSTARPFVAFTGTANACRVWVASTGPYTPALTYTIVAM